MEMGREVSCFRAACFMEVRIFRPVSVIDTPSSLPIDQMKTLG